MGDSPGRLKQFKFARHAEGKLRCVQGIVSDIKSLGGGSGDQFGGLGQEVLSSLFREAQESRDPDGVVKLAQTLTEAGIKLDRFQQVSTARSLPTQLAVRGTRKSSFVVQHVIRPEFVTGWRHLCSLSATPDGPGVWHAHRSLPIRTFDQWKDL